MVARLQKARHQVMIFLRLKMSPAYPANGTRTASVQKRIEPINPAWASVNAKSVLISESTTPKMARSAWFRKKAHQSQKSSSQR